MKIKEEKIYLIITLIIGFIMVFIIPPFQAPDEDSHFKKTYLITEGVFYPVVQDDTYGNKLPENLIIYAEDKLAYGSNRNQKFNYDKFLLDLHTLEMSDNLVYNDYSTAVKNPFIYVIPALGMVLSKIISFLVGIKVTIPSLLYGARLATLIVYSFITYYAIKISPKYKKTMLVFTLMPMSLSLYSSLSYDPLLISISVLLFAKVLKYKYDNSAKTIKSSDLLLFSLIAFIYLVLKNIYIVNMLALLLIPKEKLPSQKSDLIKKIIICVLGVGILYFATNYPISSIKISNSDSILAGKQVSYVLHHPFNYLKIYFETLVKERFFYLTTFVGVFGLLDTYLPYPIIFIYLLFIILTLLIDGNSENKNKSFNLKERLIGFIIPLASISLAFLAMYIIWTSILDGYGIGASSITGVQGRYFIPSMFFLILLFVNNFDNKIFNNIKRIYNANYYYIYIFINILSCITILLRFWI